MDFRYNHIDVYDNFAYVDGGFTYGEWLYKGILCSYGFVTGAPFWKHDGSHMKLPDREESSVFIVELDGVSLVDHWEYIGNEQEKKDDILTVKVHLKHQMQKTETRII